MSGGGWVGQLLRVDLSTGLSAVEDSTYLKQFGGGSGAAARIYLTEVAPGTQPYDAENLLIFVAGRMTGTPVPSSGRSTFYSMSPVGYPDPVCRPSSIGGFLGAELKYAGFDGLVLRGRAERPSYLLIEDDDVSVHDASDLWGLDTFETQDVLLRRHDRRAAVACIGPSGENLGRMASIVHCTGFASGMSGFGAVMGSKNLKALVVRGSGAVPVADPDRLMAAVARATALVYNSQDPPRMTGMRGLVAHFPGGEEFRDLYNTGAYACHACPIACQGVFRVPGTPLGADCCVWPYAMYAGFTEGLEGWRGCWEVNSLVNRLGLSIWESHQNYQFVTQLRDAGIITEESSGLPLNAEPLELVKALLHQIAHRRGLGEHLAEQLPRAAQLIGQDAARFVIDARGWPILLPWDDPRGHAMMAMLPAVGAHFPYTDGWFHWSFVQGTYHLTMGDEREALGEDEIGQVAQRVHGSPAAVDPSIMDNKASVLVRTQNYHMLADTLGVCTWVFPIEACFYDPELTGDDSALPELYAAVTGEEIGVDGLIELAERVFLLERLQGIKHGYHSFDRDMCALDKRLFTEPLYESPLPGHVIDADLLEQGLREYYGLRGWDRGTGLPTMETLEARGLGDLGSLLVQSDAR